jgi:hypothetical protein
MFVDSESGSVSLPEIANSLRLNGTSSYLSKVFGTPTSTNTWTYSLWIKRSSLTTLQALIADITDNDPLYLYTNDALALGISGSGVMFGTKLLRDVTSHVQITWSQTPTTATLYADNAVIETYTGTPLRMNIAGKTYGIGNNAGQFFSGYLSNVCFIDGSALTPSSFAYTDPNGQWRSLSKAALTALASAGGNNSFFLPFDNGASTTTLGQDASSKGNNWTLNSMVRDGSVSDCWSYDTPTNNFSVNNQLDKNSVTISEGALKVSTGGAYTNHRTTFEFSSGKWYAEATYISGSSNNGFVGVCDASVAITSSSWNTANGWFYNGFSGNKYTNNAGSAYGATYGANAIIGIAVDADAGTITFYKDGVSQGVAFTGLTGRVFSFSTSDPGDGPHVYVWNFGQRPVSGGAFDSASGGYFRYTPSAGYKACCAKNLATPTGAAAEPSKHVAVKTRTGTGNVSVAVSGIGFAPDWIWSKARNQAWHHNIFDRNRGVTLPLLSDGTNAEGAFSVNAQLSSFDADGYTIASTSSTNTMNDATGTYVDWLWKAGGAAVTIPAGSINGTNIASQVSANTAGGFSIVTYTGIGANATVGHGLGVAPKMVIVKDRTHASAHWVVYHQNMSATPQNDYLILSGTFAVQTASTIWNNTAPTSSVFSIGTSINTGSANNFVAYCFAEVPGFSKIGAYGGNGSADGPFVYCGFRPKFVMVKGITEAGFNWEIFDTSRIPYNDGLATGIKLEANAASAEPGITGNNIDIVANGFKLRTADWGMNKPSNTYIFIAFAEAPFKYANAR